MTPSGPVPSSGDGAGGGGDLAPSLPQRMRTGAKSTRFIITSKVHEMTASFLNDVCLVLLPARKNTCRSKRNLLYW